GARLNDHALAVRVGGENIATVAARTVRDLTDWAGSIALPEFERQVAAPILDQFRDRIAFLNDVGLGYLTLDRQMRTLSGGEAQRIALANAMGSRLVDTLYVLDEPSIGLHPRDMDRLLDLLHRLRDAGNTVVVVEHDPAAIREADYMIELGPGAGELGGNVVHAGPVTEAMDTLTGAYLSGRKRIAVPSMRRVAGPRWLRVKGATLHNLEDVDLAIPLGTLTAVTGVSGSGKSTMIHDVLYRQLERLLHGGHSAKSHLGEEIGEVSGVQGHEGIEDVVLVDQSPIGRSPRSNPVTYIKGFDDIRELFADQPEARRRGYTPSTFSFNMPGGRCETCQGAGHV
ncbi:MAG: excinuclease ABC subunit UvrA, partial [Gemmatimonadales bacterium]